MRIVLNPFASRRPYTAAEASIVSRQLAEVAHREISQWAGYETTPLRSLDHWAATLGVGSLLYKDESGRLGQGSFKALGGAYAATIRLRAIGARSGATLCCATDGNHGRSVAFAANRAGCAAVVFMHERAPADKAAAIAALGARVIRVKGTYDDSVREACASAEKEGWILIADTSEDAEDATTRLVMQGYGVMFLELLEQLQGAEPPTHVFLQGGVGGLASSVAGLLAEVHGASRPRTIVVEPESAACLLESALQQKPAKIGGELATAMEMLSAGEASSVAWPILRTRADVFIAIDDELAIDTAQALTSEHGDAFALDVGVSGAAGVAGLIGLRRQDELAALLRLDSKARVLVFGTEQRSRAAIVAP